MPSQKPLCWAGEPASRTSRSAKGFLPFIRLLTLPIPSETWEVRPRDGAFVPCRTQPPVWIQAQAVGANALLCKPNTASESAYPDDAVITRAPRCQGDSPCSQPGIRAAQGIVGANYIGGAVLVPEKATVPRVCRCGKPFLARRSYVNQGWGKYCSAECQRNAQRARRRPRKPLGWNPNPPHPIMSCSLCLYQIGFGYDRIARRIARDKRKVASFIQLRVRKHGLKRLFGVAQWLPPRKNPPEPPVDRVARSLVRMEKKKIRRLSCRLRRYVWQWIFRSYGSPLAQEMTGCTREHFRSHIEAQFTRGMSWDNYGKKWQLDHIAPCSKFNLRDPFEVRKCFHFSNYRPLGRHDNAVKHDRIIPHQPEIPLSFVPNAKIRSRKRRSPNAIGAGEKAVPPHHMHPTLGREKETS